MTKPKPSKTLPARKAPPMASIAGAKRDESDESESESELVDDALLAFVLTPALGADHLLVHAYSPAGEPVVIQDRQAAEAKRIPEPLAISITVACERWAATERRAVRFRAAWLRGDKLLASHTWECGSGTQQQALDGSVQSFLQQQQLFAQAQHKLHLEGFEMVQDGWAKLLGLQNKRIESLEKDNGELRDRLRKMDDVGSEIAIEQMRAEVEQRGRTADLLEKRILPIAQAIAAKHLQSGGDSAAAALIGNSKPEQSQQKKPAPDA